MGGVLVGSACGIVPGSKACTDTSLSTPPIHSSGPSAPLVFTATLTADGRPVADAEVVFFVYRVSPAGQEVGFNVAGGRTGADGVIRYTRKVGTEGLVLGGERLTGYQAEFRPTTDVGGVQYCRARARGELTVG